MALCLILISLSIALTLSLLNQGRVLVQGAEVGLVAPLTGG